jgi:8-oxo-dGTP pyrophosphatase MutT (NUDIX family)
MIDHFVSSKTSLHCEPAAAALLLLEDGRYILQLRDNIAPIFFPGHWGLFGGGIQDAETPLRALRRELKEELDLEIDDDEAAYFTRIDFDLSFIGRASVPRWFYAVTLSAERYGRLRLKEGAAVDAFTGAVALTTLRLTPYDAFALWLHWSRARLT